MPSVSRLHIFQERTTIWKKERNGSARPSQGATNLSKVSAATAPQIHTIRTVEDIDAVLVICLFALRVSYHQFPCSSLYSKGMPPGNYPGPLAHYFLLVLANQKHRQEIGDGGKEKAVFTSNPHLCTWG